jgi:acyl-CoA thioesterase I
VSAALKIPVVNAGVSGDTTEDALVRLDRDVLSRAPKLVLVALGGNDFLRQRPLKETFHNLDEIVRRIQEKGAMVVVAGVRSGLFGGPAGAEYKKLARRRRAALIPDLLDGVFGHPSLMSDGIHPNDAGYALVAERVRRVLEPLLK